MNYIRFDKLFFFSTQSYSLFKLTAKLSKENTTTKLDISRAEKTWKIWIAKYLYAKARTKYVLKY